MHINILKISLILLFLQIPQEFYIPGEKKVIYTILLVIINENNATIILRMNFFFIREICFSLNNVYSKNDTKNIVGIKILAEL